MQNTLKIKRTKTALAFNLAIIACEIAAIIIVFSKQAAIRLYITLKTATCLHLLPVRLWQAFRCDISKAERNSALGSNVQIYGGGCAFGNIYRSSCRAFSDAWRGHKRLALYAF